MHFKEYKSKDGTVHFLNLDAITQIMYREGHPEAWIYFTGDGESGTKVEIELAKKIQKEIETIVFQGR